GAETLAGEARADEKEQRVAGLTAELRARRAAQLCAQARVKMFEVDAAIHHVQLAGVDAKGAPDLVGHHARVANDGTQARMLEEPPLRGADVPVVRADRHAQALEHAGDPRTQLEPAPVHA